MDQCTIYPCEVFRLIPMLVVDVLSEVLHLILNGEVVI